MHKFNCTENNSGGQRNVPSDTTFDDLNFFRKVEEKVIKRLQRVERLQRAERVERVR